MKVIRLLLLPLAALCALTTLSAQNVTWKNSVEQLGGDTCRIVFEAAIPQGYHMYDMGPYAEGGPNATEITLTPSAGVTLIGNVEQLTKPNRYFDKTFKMEIGTFDHAARFGQKALVTVPTASVEASLYWMICDATTCLPPDTQDMTIALKGSSSTVASADSTAVSAAKPMPIAPDASGNTSLWGFIVKALLWGFAALLTPCVFPMIPMTVSFFLKSGGSPARNRFRAAMYGLFIVLLYTLPIAAIILITRLVGGDAATAGIFNWLSTHWLPNLIFFVVFMVFAASFFGAFEITLPSRFVNGSDRQADRKGMLGVFFMALTLVLVSFSCTGPLVGSALVESTRGEFWAPILTMFAFSVAFALPFTIFAFFPSLLKKLPKSGGWLNSVKVVLGFVEVALGLKFLSVADQTYHWGILDREVYLAIWIAVFFLLGFYLLGKIKFAHDDDLHHIGVGRLLLAIITFSFVVYLVPGMFGAPLKALSGYLPPLETQDFVLGSGSAPAPANTAGQLTVDGRSPKYSDLLHLPLGLQGFFDLREAEAYAAKVDKPLFVDITGHGCVNCREMEARVWADSEVLGILRDQYVICALYVDDKKRLPESDWVTTDNGRVLKGLGQINAYNTLTAYGVNAQPTYILQGRAGKVLVPPRGYNLDIAAFVKFLQSGLEAYNQ